MKVTTNSGFTADIDKAILDDWEFLELLAEADDGNLIAYIKCMMRLLGKDQYDKLKEHLRDDEGKVSAAAIQSAFLEMINSDVDLKNE